MLHTFEKPAKQRLMLLLRNLKKNEIQSDCPHTHQICFNFLWSR